MGCLTAVRVRVCVLALPAWRYLSLAACDLDELTCEAFGSQCRDRLQDLFETWTETAYPGDDVGLASARAGADYVPEVF